MKVCDIDEYGNIKLSICKQMDETAWTEITKRDGHQCKVYHNERLLQDTNSVPSIVDSGPSTLTVIWKRAFASPNTSSIDVRDITQADIDAKTVGVASSTSSIGKDAAHEVHRRLKEFMGGLFKIGQGDDDDDEDDEEELERPGSSEPSEHLDSESFVQLTAIGYSRNAALRALTYCDGNLERSLEWLLQRPDDNALDEELTSQEILKIKAERRSRRKKKRAKPPRQANPGLVGNLTDMGFTQEDATAALIQTRNNLEAALEWLLGDREAPEEDSSDEDEAAAWLNDPNVALLLSNPVVQNGLTNPRVLSAFREILEDPESTERHLQDPEVGLVLLQVNSVLQAAESNAL